MPSKSDRPQHQVEHVIREETMLAMYDLKSTSTDMSDMSFNSGVRIHGLRGETTSMLIRQEREYWRSMQKYKGVDIMSMVTLLAHNKDKILDLTKTPVNENCSAVILKTFPEKLGDPGRFLIPCDFPELDECLALADLGASINLMPLSIFEKLNRQGLTKTRMVLELADRSISTSHRLTEDVFVKVGTSTFQRFCGSDYDADPRVPLILGRPFLRTARALIDVHGEEMTLRHDDKSVTFKVGDTKNFSYNAMESVNKVDFIDIACEEYSQEILGFSEVLANGNSTPYFEPIVDTTSPTLTPFEGSDFILEEIEAELSDTSYKSELKMPKGDNKLPVIIAKDLSVGEKAALIKVLQSHKRAIAWKLSDNSRIVPGSYLVMNKCTVYTDHSALKYLFAKKDSKARLPPMGSATSSSTLM
ncbi:reverse transcriptase domain-containing protein [Tanacetum coccineum]|uniref:Reverse transcriptase domain-containing protein n=1 Tax=Tanacetum coccineum TaxID=301880 RepID=A0ABQ5HAR2_9ASTR